MNLIQRRIGPLPVWVWFLMLVLGVYLFLRFRANRGGQSPSTIDDADNLTSQQATLIPWSTDVFINVPQQTVPPTTSKGPVKVVVPPKGTPRYGSAGGWLANPPQNPGPRQTSVTYQAPRGTEPMRAASLASLLGFAGRARSFNSNPLVIPA